MNPKKIQQSIYRTNQNAKNKNEKEETQKLIASIEKEVLNKLKIDFFILIALLFELSPIHFCYIIIIYAIFFLCEQRLNEFLESFAQAHNIEVKSTTATTKIHKSVFCFDRNQLTEFGPFET